MIRWLLVLGFGWNGLMLSAQEIDDQLKVSCVEILREGLRLDAFWPSMHAAEALTLAGYETEVVDFLEPKFKEEEDDQRRCGLARELVRAGQSRYGDELFRILQKEDDHGHVHAAESLYKVGWNGDGKPLADAFSKSDNLRLKLMAAAALARHDRDAMGEEAMVFLRNHLRNEADPNLFRLTAWVLGRVGDASDVERIKARVEQASDPLVHAFLMHALAALGDSEGKAALLKNLSSDDAAIRTYAAVFAGEIGISEARADLVELLRDGNPDTRIRAAQAILTLTLKN